MKGKKLNPDQIKQIEKAINNRGIGIDIIKTKKGKNIFERIIQKMYLEGDITEDELQNEKLLKMLFLISINNSNFVIDHQDSLLESAIYFKSINDRNKAILFYAIYFEHTLNRIIKHACEKKKIQEKLYSEIIKSVNIKGKITWLLPLLELPKLNPLVIKEILEIADERNAYIHYKYKPSFNLAKDELIKNYTQSYKNIAKAITYLKKYESNIIYKGKKGTILKRINYKTLFTKSTSPPIQQ